VPAEVVATVLVLQALEGLSDREAISALRRDNAWRVACGLRLDPEATQVLVPGLVNDALAVLSAVGEVEGDAEQAEAVALLALVAGQDVEPEPAARIVADRSARMPAGPARSGATATRPTSPPNPRDWRCWATRPTAAGDHARLPAKLPALAADGGTRDRSPHHARANARLLRERPVGLDRQASAGS
jgi:hypothetical protein